MTVAAETLKSTFVDRGIDFDAVYEMHVPTMIGVAVDHFHISETDAQTLAHEVFMAFFFKAEDIRDVHAWFIGAMCNASRHYLRTRAKHVPLPPEIVDEPDPRFTRDSFPNQIAAHEAFACLTPRCQLALRMRYLEGYSVPEIALQLHTTPKYAQKLVTRCLRQARDRYTAKGGM